MSIIRSVCKIKKVSVSINIDGKQDLPTLKDGSYDLDPNKKIIQVPLTAKELKDAEDILAHGNGSHVVINFRILKLIFNFF